MIFNKYINEFKIPKKIIKRKRKLLFYSLFIILTIWSYYAYIQIIKGTFYFIQSIKNYTRYIKINAIRGKIIDRNNLIIASTKPIIELYWKYLPSKLSENDLVIVDFFLKHFNIDILKLVHDNKTKKKLIKLNYSTDFNMLCTLLEKFPENDRIEIVTKKKRIYPFNEYACHLIGYINNNQNGISGIEKIYNNPLTGEQGIIEKIINSKGDFVNEKIINNASNGIEIKTTLDIKLQSILENLFPNTIKGCALIFDPENGHIKAMLSSPRYNPKIFLKKIDKETWSEFVKNKSLINRCTQAVYPPASTFKFITAIAALEEKIINEHTSWCCNGHMEYKGRKYHCHLKSGHGLINIKQALTFSCNIPFYHLAINGIGIDTLHKYATSMGLGEITGSNLPESKGLIPSKSWKRQFTKEKQWYTGETMSVIIGQGATLVTPLQIARAMGAFFTGFLVKPIIIFNEEIIKKPVSLSQSTKTIIKQALNLATIEGTSKPLKSIPGWDIYAKTGTAQLKKIERNENDTSVEEEKESLKHHGEIVCYAKHNKTSPLILYIMLENIGSSKKAVILAKKFFLEYNKILI